MCSIFFKTHFITGFVCFFHYVKVESSFLSLESNRQNLQTIMFNVREKLNSCGFCTINIGAVYVVVRSYPHVHCNCRFSVMSLSNRHIVNSMGVLSAVHSHSIKLSVVIIHKQCNLSLVHRIY